MIKKSNTLSQPQPDSKAKPKSDLTPTREAHFRDAEDQHSGDMTILTKCPGVLQDHGDYSRLNNNTS